jgi:hypothetical protein
MSMRRGVYENRKAGLINKARCRKKERRVCGGLDPLRTDVVRKGNKRRGRRAVYSTHKETEISTADWAERKTSREGERVRESGGEGDLTTSRRKALFCSSACFGRRASSRSSIAVAVSCPSENKRQLNIRHRSASLVTVHLMSSSTATSCTGRRWRWSADQRVVDRSRTSPT